MTVTLSRTDTIAIVTIDNPPVNAAGHAVRQGLHDAVATCDADPAVTAVVVICAGRTFVAGADIREFGKPPVAPWLPDVITTIEGAAKPWVAAIHGTALGGGLEIAMGCHARVALRSAKVGLPEVNLGLIPGAGGTVRLPRLVAAETALTMVASGKPISAEVAHTAGLIDHFVDADLQDAAMAFAKTLTTPAPTLQRAVRPPADPEAFAKQAAQLRRKARGQMSTGAAIEAVERSLSEPADLALQHEREAFLVLQASTQSAALRHVFFAERAGLSDPRCKLVPRSVTKLAVIGGGTMGAGIAVACLTSGYRVSMIERDAEAAAAGADRVTGLLAGSAKRGLLSDTQHQAALDRFDTSASYEATADADLVVEAVFEDMDVKRDVFAQLQQHTREDAILATNTSYLDVAELARTLDDPSRVIGLHFFSPAHIMKLLEIVVHDDVADDVVATAAKLSKKLGKIGVLSGVCDGFIGNRIMSTYRREADYLIEDGALPWEVDAAMRDFGFPMGVFEMQDLAGLDIAWAMRKRRAATRPASERYVEIPDQLCEAGRLGRKTGHGWYDYVDGRAVPSDTVRAMIEAARVAKGLTPQTLDADAIMARILGVMQSEGQQVVDEGIAQRASDVDVVMVNGYGFPRWRGGPLFMASQD